jgi:hypothetical protein
MPSALAMTTWGIVKAPKRNQAKPNQTKSDPTHKAKTCSSQNLPIRCRSDQIRSNQPEEENLVTPEEEDLLIPAEEECLATPEEDPLFPEEWEDLLAYATGAHGRGSG